MVITPEYCKYKWGIQLLNKYRWSFILPPQTTLKGCPLKIYTHWHCLILKKVGNLMISAVLEPYCWWFRNPEVTSWGSCLVYPIIYRVLNIHPKVVDLTLAVGLFLLLAVAVDDQKANASVFQPESSWKRTPILRNGSICIITIVILRQSDIHFGIW